MKLTSLRPMINTHSLDDTINFYCKILGFICAERNDDWGWAWLNKDAVEIMIALPNEHSPFDKPQFTGSFYFNTDDVDSLWNILKDKVEIVYPVDNFDYGMREFAIYDNNGYMLQFGQELNK